MKRFGVEGSWPALVTPFTGEDKVNFEILRRLVDFHVECASDGILILGSTRMRGPG
jgi:dihydrodipicolinate synthase/N-acetylneuraminate lyase